MRLGLFAFTILILAAPTKNAKAAQIIESWDLSNYEGQIFLSETMDGDRTAIMTMDVVESPEAVFAAYIQLRSREKIPPILKIGYQNADEAIDVARLIADATIAKNNLWIFPNPKEEMRLITYAEAAYFPYYVLINKASRRTEKGSLALDQFRRSDLSTAVKMGLKGLSRRSKADDPCSFFRE